MYLKFYKNAEGAEILVASPNAINSLVMNVLVLDPDPDCPDLPQIDYGFTLFPCARATMFADSYASCQKYGPGSENGGCATAAAKLGFDSNWKLGSGVNARDPFSKNTVFYYEDETERAYVKKLCETICPAIPEADINNFFKKIAKLAKLEEKETKLEDALLDLVKDGGTYKCVPIIRSRFNNVVSTLIGRGDLGISQDGIVALTNLRGLYDGSLEEPKVGDKPPLIGFDATDLVKIASAIPGIVGGTGSATEALSRAVFSCFADFGLAPSSAKKAAKAKLEEAIADELA